MTGPFFGAAVDDQALAVSLLLRQQGGTLAVAESLTGGLLGAALTGPAGASATFLGGVVAYATQAKQTLLSVPADLLAANGPVDAEVALAMAEGTRQLFGAGWGLSTTGVAGPEPQGAAAPGTVFVACVGPPGGAVRRLMLPGDRSAVRASTVAEALLLLIDLLEELIDRGGSG